MKQCLRAVGLSGGFELTQGRWRAIDCEGFTIPDGTAFLAFFGGCEGVVIEHGADEFGRLLGERVLFEHGQNLGGAFKQVGEEGLKPRSRFHAVERGEPHLPVESRLVWGDCRESVVGSAWLVAEFVGLPLMAVVAALDDDFTALCCHDGEKSIAIDRSKRRKE